jgi:hypothetical protein
MQAGSLVGFGSGDENRYVKRDAPMCLSHSCASRQVSPSRPAQQARQAHDFSLTPKDVSWPTRKQDNPDKRTSCTVACIKRPAKITGACHERLHKFSDFVVAAT